MSVFKNEEKHPRAETIRDCDLVFFLNIYIFRFVLFFVWLNQNESTNTPDDCDP